MASIPGLEPGAPGAGGPSGAGGDSGGNAYEFTVGELSIELKRAVEDRFGHVRLRGEISGWKTPASGHAYFTLKDEDACIDAVMWRTSRARLDFVPEDGLEVIAQGRVTTYPGRSKYQIVVERMAVAGAGALMALLEKRKAALGAEGLFAPERKRALPFLPRRIGIVTSPTGAVIRDMLHRLEERFPRNVLLWPVRVQGDGAAEEVARGIAGLNARPDAPDLIIVARGGGSIEDLWAFNEEVVVRAVAASGIPVISAVGHETDTTLCDFAADHRAPTPTAAAERAVPVRAELAALVADQAARLDGAMRQGQRACTERAAMLAARLPAPATLIEARQQRLDDLAARLPGPGTIFDMRAERLAALEDRLRRGGMQARRDADRDLQRVSARLGPDLLQRSWLRQDQRLKDTGRVLASLDPRRPLQRGFALVEGPGGRPVTSAAHAGELANLTLRFSDGALSVRTASGSEPDDPSGGSGPEEPNSAQRERPKRTKAPKPAPTGQPDLF